MQFRGVLWLSLSALAPWCTLAQSTFGTVLGTVRDPQSAAVPGATVVVSNPDRGWKMSASTDDSGNYSVYPVPEGVYRVTAEAAGFQTKHVSGVRVDLDSRVRVDLALGLASLDVSVTVQAAASVVQTETGGLESVIENQQILELPLNGRNIMDLAYLAPGAVKNITNAGLGDFAANGNRPWGNALTLDGVPTRDEVRAQSGSVTVSVDAVQQFKMKSANATAEYGGGGAQMALVVKSGTNQLHGAGFLFNRSTLGQARSFFSRTNDLPEFFRDQFGGSLSGPIRRNRTFFFVNYESNHMRNAVQALYSLPTQAMRDGNFQGVHDGSGRLLTLATPTAMPWKLTAGQAMYSQPNVINPFYLADSPANPNRKNVAIAKALLSYLELPNGDGEANNFASARPSITTSNQGTVRIDHQLKPGHSLSVRSTTMRSDLNYGDQVAYSLGYVLGNNNDNGVAGLTSMLRPNLINEFRFGWQSYREVAVASSTRNLIQEFGIVEPAKLPDYAPFLDRIPNVAFNGNGAFNGVQYFQNPAVGSGAGDSIPYSLINSNYSLNNNITWQKGRHGIKAGYYFKFIRFTDNVVYAPRGYVTYYGRTSATSTGYSVADMLLGLPYNSNYKLFPPEMTYRTTEQAAFVQDDWRVTSRLSLGVGLRWEARQMPYETHGMFSIFDLNSGKIIVPSPGGKISSNAYPELLSAYGKLIATATQVGWDERRLVDTDWLNFAPRFGFVLGLDRRSNFVLRGAYGIFYSFTPFFSFFGGQPLPFGAASSATSSASNVLSNENPFRVTTGGAPAVASMSQRFPNAYNQQWNLSLERVLFREAVVSLSYVGNRGVHLSGQQERNPSYKVYPSFASITERNADFLSLYNAMQFEFRRRYSRGLSYQVNWTWAKSIDDMGGSMGNASEDLEIRSLNRRSNRADSDFVNRHAVRWNFLWDMPIGGKSGRGSNWNPVMKALFGRWSMGGIAQWNSGVFATPQSSGGGFNARPDVVAGVNWRLSDEDRQRLAQQTGDRSYLDPSLRWYNPLAFSAVTGRPGNSGRNVLVGPAFFNIDAAVSKRFHIRPLPERAVTTLRIEGFNVFNHVSFSARSLNLYVNQAPAGAFSAVVGNPRQIQFGIRTDF